MMTVLRWLLGADVAPITHKTVRPAPRPEEKEREIRAAQARQVREIMTVERRSVQIRQALAGNVLNIVSGDDQ